MKSIKNLLIMLMAVTTVIFSSCDEPLNSDGPVTPNTINTFAPEISEGRVTFKGRISQPDKVIEYGFMWYQRNGGSGDIQRVVVGSGNLDGEFEKVMNDLPRNSDMTVCAFVTYEFEDDYPYEAIGEEIDFSYD